MNFNLNVAKALLGAAAFAGAITAIAQPASAISVNTGGTTLLNNGLISSYGGVTTLDFNTDSLGGRIGGGTIVNGSVSGQYAAPPNDTSNYLAVLGGKTAQFDLGGLKGYFGLFVGSLDTFNTIEFINTVAKTSQAFTGTQVAFSTGTPATGDQTKGVYYNFFGDNNSDLFNTVKLSSSQNAFEVDNIATRAAIPTPALLPGLIGMGVAAWRKRKGESAEQSEA
jgi:hypothetical protein